MKYKTNTFGISSADPLINDTSFKKGAANRIPKFNKILYVQHYPKNRQRILAHEHFSLFIFQKIVKNVD